jgi:hypothetical protein
MRARGRSVIELLGKDLPNKKNASKRAARSARKSHHSMKKKNILGRMNKCRINT